MDDAQTRKADLGGISVKPKALRLLSLLAASSPVAGAFLMTFFEEEVVEAILSGILCGTVVGSAIGIFVLFSNRGKDKLNAVLSAAPICLLVFFAVLAIPYWLFS